MKNKINKWKQKKNMKYENKKGAVECRVWTITVYYYIVLCSINVFHHSLFFPHVIYTLYSIILSFVFSSSIFYMSFASSNKTIEVDLFNSTTSRNHIDQEEKRKKKNFVSNSNTERKSGKVFRFFFSSIYFFYQRFYHLLFIIIIIYEHKTTRLLRLALD